MFGRNVSLAAGLVALAVSAAHAGHDHAQHDHAQHVEFSLRSIKDGARSDVKTWANRRNTLVRNAACDNNLYGFGYDMQDASQSDSRLPILQPDGKKRVVDVRTIPIGRFEDNAAHANFAGMVVAANSDAQPDDAIRDEASFERIRRVDWTGPDAAPSARHSPFRHLGGPLGLPPAQPFDADRWTAHRLKQNSIFSPLAPPARIPPVR